MNCIFVNKWISWRKYIHENNSVNLIFNQKTKCYYVLKNDLSEIWDNILKNDISLNNPFLYAFEKEGIISFDGGVVPLKKGTIIELPSCKNIPTDFLSWINSAGFIFDVHWDLTLNCNAKCIHCYNRCISQIAQNEVFNELSLEESKKLLDQLVQLGVFRLVLSGGEATLKRNFLDIYNYARDNGFQIILYTNGISQDISLLSEIIKRYPSELSFSLYSDDEGIHESITMVKNSYKRTMGSLKYLKDHDVDTSCKNVLLKMNYKTWKSTLNNGYKYATHSMVNYVFYPFLDGNSDAFKHQINFLQAIDFVKDCDSPIYYERRIVKDCSYLKGEDRHPCYDTTNAIYIDPEGIIYPCISLRYKIGSFREGTLLSLKVPKSEVRKPFNKDFEKIISHKERIKNWRALKNKDLFECGNYKYCDFCIDLCPGDAFYITGSLLSAAHNHCIMALARYVAFKEKNCGEMLLDIIEDLKDENLPDKSFLEQIEKSLH